MLVKQQDNQQLYIHFLPLLKAGVIQKTFLREISPLDLLQETLSSKLTSQKKNFHNFELKELSKIMIAGSYLASYIPEKSDVRLFSWKNLSKKKKARKEETDLDFGSEPKFFSIERLYHIIKAITASDKIHLDIQFFDQVSLLIAAKLLTFNPFQNLNNIKLKCLAKYSDVSLWARQVKIDLESYLH